MKKILIVDDSPTELKLIADVFNAAYFTIVTAVDGETAVETALAEKPDLIILDVVMPKMNGFQACRKIKTTPELKDTPVILVTSKNQESDEFWGIKQGADVYMTKPFNAVELMSKAKALLA